MSFSIIFSSSCSHKLMGMSIPSYNHNYPHLFFSIHRPHQDFTHHFSLSILLQHIQNTSPHHLFSLPRFTFLLTNNLLIKIHHLLTKIYFSPHQDPFPSSSRFTSPKFHQILINFSKGFQGASRDLIYIKT
ncbi:hypothetical protein RchiOBHm_Chr2g0153501 [Rosa chinensis]|uniref:Uncharacterized protein n=1 Tax=Rosa chinensis TaxID=74649 RepID=A0A2P6S0P1_ROSCH|nr:hypothetical protein RchiOBHm_Chr2g0153501 [Rosa chinensis]